MYPITDTTYQGFHGITYHLPDTIYESGPIAFIWYQENPIGLKSWYHIYSRAWAENA